MAKSSTGHYNLDGFSPPGLCSVCGQAVKRSSSGMKEAADERALPEHSPPRALCCPPGPHHLVPLGAVTPCSGLAAVVPMDG